MTAALAGQPNSTTKAASVRVPGDVALMTPWGAVLQPADYSVLWSDDIPSVPLCQIFYSGLRTIVTTGNPAMVDPWLLPFFNGIPTTTPENQIVISSGMDGWTDA